MTSVFKICLLLLALTLGGAGSQAETIFFTDFDGRMVTGPTNDIASNLGWAPPRGIDDPGDMAVEVNGSTNWPLFNGAGQITTNMFAPSWNYGNLGGYWSTTLDLKIPAGFVVTLTNVIFDYWALEGGETLNVNRRADFAATLFGPTALPIASVTNLDILGGSGAGVPTVILTFASPVALTNPGVYTVEVKAGELGGINETGNHVGIDNLSVNGAVEQPNLVAWTDFNSRTVTGASSHIATTLDWVTRGVETPGNMISRRDDSVDQILFDGAGQITQDMFAPAFNYGNLDGYWGTSLDLDVASGFYVTLTDITFEYWALSGTETYQTASRGADFKVTLLSPSAVPLVTVTNQDILGGAGAGVPIVTMTFPAPILMSSAGAYTLEIRAGELGGVPKTGNHLGIDNLSINGIVEIKPAGTVIILQ